MSAQSIYPSSTVPICFNFPQNERSLSEKGRDERLVSARNAALHTRRDFAASVAAVAPEFQEGHLFSSTSGMQKIASDYITTLEGDSTADRINGCVKRFCKLLLRRHPAVHVDTIVAALLDGTCPPGGLPGRVGDLLHVSTHQEPAKSTTASERTKLFAEREEQALNLMHGLFQPDPARVHGGCPPPAEEGPSAAPTVAGSGDDGSGTFNAFAALQCPPSCLATRLWHFGRAWRWHCAVKRTSKAIRAAATPASPTGQAPSPAPAPPAAAERGAAAAVAGARQGAGAGEGEAARHQASPVYQEAEADACESDTIVEDEDNEDGEDVATDGEACRAIVDTLAGSKTMTAVRAEASEYLVQAAVFARIVLARATEAWTSGPVATAARVALAGPGGTPKQPPAPTRMTPKPEAQKRHLRYDKDTLFLAFLKSLLVNTNGWASSLRREAGRKYSVDEELNMSKRALAKAQEVPAACGSGGSDAKSSLCEKKSSRRRRRRRRRRHAKQARDRKVKAATAAIRRSGTGSGDTAAGAAAGDDDTAAATAQVELERDNGRGFLDFTVLDAGRRREEGLFQARAEAAYVTKRFFCLTSQRVRGGTTDPEAQQRVVERRLRLRAGGGSNWYFYPPRMETKVPDNTDLEKWSRTTQHDLPTLDEPRGLDRVLLTLAAADRFLPPTGRPRRGPVGRLLAAAKAEREKLYEDFEVAHYLGGAVNLNDLRGTPRVPVSLTTDGVALHFSLHRVRKVTAFVEASVAKKVHGKIFDAAPESSKIYPSSNTDAFEAKVNGAYALGCLDVRALLTSVKYVSSWDPGQTSLATGYRMALKDWLACRADVAAHYREGDWFPAPAAQRGGIYRGASFCDPGPGFKTTLHPSDPRSTTGGAGAGAGAPLPSTAATAGVRAKPNAWRARRAKGKVYRLAARKQRCRAFVTFWQIRKRSWLAWSGAQRTMKKGKRSKLEARLGMLKQKIADPSRKDTVKRRCRRELRAARRWLCQASARPAYVNEALRKLEQVSASRNVPDTARGTAALKERLSIVLDRTAFWRYFASTTRARNKFARRGQREAALERIVSVLAPTRDCLVMLGSWPGRAAVRGESQAAPAKAIQRALAKRRRLVLVQEHKTSQRCARCMSTTRKVVHPVSTKVRRRKGQLEEAKRRWAVEHGGRAPTPAEVKEHGVEFLPYPRTITTTSRCEVCDGCVNRDLSACWCIGRAAFGYIVESARPAFLCSDKELERRRQADADAEAGGGESQPVAGDQRGGRSKSGSRKRRRVCGNGTSRRPNKRGPHSRSTRGNGRRFSRKRAHGGGKQGDAATEERLDAEADGTAVGSAGAAQPQRGEGRSVDAGGQLAVGGGEPVAQPRKRLARACIASAERLIAAVAASESSGDEA